MGRGRDGEGMGWGGMGWGGNGMGRGEVGGRGACMHAWVPFSTKARVVAAGVLGADSYARDDAACVRGKRFVLLERCV